jgi:hypothetical protein
MMISKKALDKIRKIIDKNYKALLINVVGTRVFSDDELRRLKDLGLDVEDKDSLLSLVYYNNVLNDLISTTGPTSIDDMLAQQKGKPTGEGHEAAEEHINQNFVQAVEKLKTSTQASMEGIIRDYNLTYRNNALQNLERPEEMDKLVMQSSVGGLKQSLRDYSGDATRDWNRVAVTETANAMGIGSVDRVVMQNRDKDLEEVYVFRIPVNDAALCKFCRKFYLDADGSPAVYRMSTLLNNGTNYGRKPADWKPVAGATHPNDRESGVLELRPGWKVVAEGRLEFIGVPAWKEYIKKKLRD